MDKLNEYQSKFEGYSDLKKSENLMKLKLGKISYDSFIEKKEEKGLLEIKKLIATAKEDFDISMNKIINYLLYIVKEIDFFNKQNNKDCLKKVLNYLYDYRMLNPLIQLEVKILV